MPEFKEWPKIKKFDQYPMVITQKIHGSNGQILVTEDKIYAGSRTRWLCPEHDNYDFYKFVKANEHEIREKLGLGTHYGEWAGPGINNGEGLKERNFILFSQDRYDPNNLPIQMQIVPKLYESTSLSSGEVELIMKLLKETGSNLVPGFMNVEGIVIEFAGMRFKKVFKPEETAWAGQKKNKAKIKRIRPEVAYLLQPLRLEKLLSKDSTLRENFPRTIKEVVEIYIKDLKAEGQFKGEVELEEQYLRTCIFIFIKDNINVIN